MSSFSCPRVSLKKIVFSAKEVKIEAKQDRLGEDSTWRPQRVVNARFDEPPSAVVADDSEEAEVRAAVEASRPIPDEHRPPGPW
jgi:hypothetical protein